MRNIESASFNLPVMMTAKRQKIAQVISLFVMSWRKISAGLKVMHNEWMARLLCGASANPTLISISNQSLFSLLRPIGAVIGFTTTPPKVTIGTTHVQTKPTAMTNLIAKLVRKLLEIRNAFQRLATKTTLRLITPFSFLPHQSIATFLATSKATRTMPIPIRGVDKCLAAYYTDALVRYGARLGLAIAQQRTIFALPLFKAGGFSPKGLIAKQASLFNRHIDTKWPLGASRVAGVSQATAPRGHEKSLLSYLAD